VTARSQECKRSQPFQRSRSSKGTRDPNSGASLLVITKHEDITIDILISRQFVSRDIVESRDDLDLLTQ
jgi:hypothetical protein